MNAQISDEHATQIPSAATLALKLEVVIIPVSDVDREGALQMAGGRR
jgi:hypothetical protein